MVDPCTKSKVIGRIIVGNIIVDTKITKSQDLGMLIWNSIQDKV